MPKNDKEKIKAPQLLRGMKDILPSEQKYWDYLRSKITSFLQDYGFKRIDTPILEETSLFIRSVGKGTDIVDKEMFSFADQSGDNVALRPEGTASVCRAYIEHGMVNQPQPVKLFYLGPFFRHDRPQAGRHRQFHQFGFEVLGDSHPVIDAQVLMTTYNLYKELGLDIVLQINSIGCPACQENYKKILVEYYKTRRNSLCEDCKKRLLKNPLRLLDCKQDDCQTLAASAPQIVDNLCEECHEHFVKALENLDEVEVPYSLNPRLVRGLDYYTRTAFEVWPAGVEDKQASQTALGGGGRYDQLIESLGGRSTPAIGYAGGFERLINKIKEQVIAVPDEKTPDIFVAQLGDLARKKSLRLFEELRKAGLKASETFSKDGMKDQMATANKSGVRYALILGQKEMNDGTIILRDMESGIQETIDYKKIVNEIKKRLSRWGVNNNHI